MVGGKIKIYNHSTKYTSSQKTKQNKISDAVVREEQHRRNHNEIS